jgi:hypothetical protein
MKPYFTKFIFAYSLLFSVPYLVSCAELPLVANAAGAINYAVFGAPETEITREIVGSIPYASISAKIGSGPRSILVLGKSQNEIKHWFSADGAVIVTRNGRVTQTAGFPENLKATIQKTIDPINRLLHKRKFGKSDYSLNHLRNIDISVEDRYGIPVRSRYETIGHREIDIAGIKIKTILVKEENRAFTINWTFTNYYWADAFDGYIWKSRQHIVRSFPPIDIEILKPES